MGNLGKCSPGCLRVAYRGCEARPDCDQAPTPGKKWSRMTIWNITSNGSGGLTATPGGDGDIMWAGLMLALFTVGGMLLLGAVSYPISMAVKAVGLSGKTGAMVAFRATYLLPLAAYLLTILYQAGGFGKLKESATADYVSWKSKFSIGSTSRGSGPDVRSSFEQLTILGVTLVSLAVFPVVLAVVLSIVFGLIGLAWVGLTVWLAHYFDVSHELLNNAGEYWTDGIVAAIIFVPAILIMQINIFRDLLSDLWREGF